MKSYKSKQEIFALELKASKATSTAQHKVEVPNNRAARRLMAKLIRQGKEEPKDTP